MNRTKTIFILLPVIALACIACNFFYVSHQFRHVYNDANAFLHTDTAGTNFLKAHMKNGDVYVLENKWKEVNDSILRGTGTHYDFNRNLLDKSTFDISIHDIAILETNKPIVSRDQEHITGLAIITVIDVIIAVACLTNPKACFGSCPTFYYQKDDHLNCANAEGFSDAISPSMEYGDVDALNNPLLTNDEFLLTMKNEALETHAVNQVKLLTFPRKTDHRIYHDGKQNFYDCQSTSTSFKALCNENDITDLVKDVDEKEWFCPSDSNDLSSKEIIDIRFDHTAIHGQAGLLINFRQTLLTTFLLYSAYGYMGNEVGDLFAKIESDGGLRKNLSACQQYLGAIEAQVFDDHSGEWLNAGKIYETGPIAKNLQLITLPTEIKNQENIHVRLLLTKGLWRIDYAALTDIQQQVVPEELRPDWVDKNGISEPGALNNLAADDDHHEVSLPGDVYKIHFNIPEPGTDHEIFVYSKGYYLEWIRGEWLKEKNLPKLRHMLKGDEATWHSLAREFKSLEPSMESTFWSSKVSQ